MGVRRLRASLEPCTLDYAEQIIGISADVLRRAAQEIAHAERVCALWALGITQRTNGSGTSTAISNLLLLTATTGAAAPAANRCAATTTCKAPATRCSRAGIESAPKVGDDDGRKRLEDEWGVSLPSEPGLNNTTMIEAAEEGNLKGRFVVGVELGLAERRV